MNFKDVAQGDLFRLTATSAWHVKKDNGFVSDGTTYTLSPDVCVECMSPDQIAGTIADHLLRLKAAKAFYAKMSDDKQRNIRHTVYQRTGKLGKDYFRD